MPSIQKPVFTIAMLGATQHGKTSLMESLQRAYRGSTSSRFRGGKELRFETSQRVYSLLDGERQNGVLQSLLFGPVRPDAAVLVVRADVGVTDDTAAQLRCLKLLSVSSLVVFLSGVDLVKDEYQLDYFEVSIREQLQQENFDGDAIRIHRGDVVGLVSSLEELHLAPRPQIDDFLMLIDERFGSSSSSKELIVSGKVLRGEVKVGDSVALCSIDKQGSAKILGLDVVTQSQKTHTSLMEVGVIREKRNKATRGQWVGCRLERTHLDVLYDCYALAKPNSVKIYKEVKALLWLENSVAASSLLFRIRGENGALRKLLVGASDKPLETQKLLEVTNVSSLGVGHVSAPAYFDILVPRFPNAVGFGVFISLR